MNETTDAPAIFGPLWHRKWLILAVGVLIGVATYAYYRRQPTLYSASSQIYLSSGAEEQGLSGSSLLKGTLNSRAVTDQATLINSSAVGEPVRRRLRAEHKLAAAHGKVQASGGASSDFVTITAEAHTSKAAVVLASAYANYYVERQRKSYRRKITSAIDATRRQLHRIEAAQSAPQSHSLKRGARFTTTTSAAPSGGLATIQAADLVSKINQLESSLSVTGVQEISPGKVQATLLSPRPKRNAIFGFALGLLLASIIAYIASRIDRRLRSLSHIEELFHTQVLAALPSTREQRIVRRDGKLAPAPSLLEPLRRLHTTLQLGDMLERDRERSPRTILFVSAQQGDGVSTVISDLALVQRDAGERVAVIDADLRNPTQARLLEVAGPHGLTEVLAGTLTAAEALQRVEPLPYQADAGTVTVAPGAGRAAGPSTLVQARAAGSVSVLASGASAANPPALLASRAMSGLLRALAEDFDRVLIDAPSPLQVADVMPLLGAVDGIVLVARAGQTREVAAQRLIELLARVASAPVLGVVANCVPRGELEQYGFAAASGKQAWSGKLVGR